jgi:hypothetical protein
MINMAFEHNTRSESSLALLALSSFVTFAKADSPFAMCTDNVCQLCPVSVTSSGTNYVTYTTFDVVSLLLYFSSWPKKDLIALILFKHLADQSLLTSS